MVNAKKGVLVGLVALSMSLSVSATMCKSPTPIVAYAEGLEDDFVSPNSGGGDFYNGEVSQEDKEVGNIIKNHRGMTSEQLSKASVAISPLTNAIGYLVGGIIALLFCAIFFVTALDLLYLSFPAVRGLLYKGGSDGTGRDIHGTIDDNHHIQWISDEAAMCAAVLGGTAQANQGNEYQQYTGNGGGSNPQKPTTKVLLATYFKKRVIAMVMLVICAVVLTSSALLGTGVNLAQFILKLIDILNKYIPL